MVKPKPERMVEMFSRIDPQTPRCSCRTVTLTGCETDGTPPWMIT